MSDKMSFTKSRLWIALLVTLLVFLLPIGQAFAEEGEEDKEPVDITKAESDAKIRGIYIYDERDFLPHDSEVALGWYLWNLDLKTRYEMVLVFPKEKLSEQQIIERFNKLGVGKKKKDNGAALFVFPDNSMFMAIGSGNDKITVTKSKTYGERIFADFKDDPVLTLLRFLSKIGGDVDKSTVTGKLGDLGETLWANIDIVLLWALVFALMVFLIQQFNGFQATDFILPGLVFVITMIFVGIAIASGGSKPTSYTSYGVITSTHHSSDTYIEPHTICTSTGKTTTCHTILHTHTRYINDVTLISYELNAYKDRFISTDNRWAWRRDIGEVEQLKIGIEKGDLQSMYPARLGQDSGGITKGDGTWIYAAMEKLKK